MKTCFLLFAVIVCIGFSGLFLGCCLEQRQNSQTPPDFEQEKAELRTYAVRQKKLRSLIAEGDVFRLKDPFAGNEFCMEVLSKDKKTAYVVWVHFFAAANPPPMRLRFRGLDKAACYLVEETGQRLMGDVLVNAGLPLPLPYGDFISETFTLKVCPKGAEEGKNER